MSQYAGGRAVLPLLFLLLTLIGVAFGGPTSASATEPDPAAPEIPAAVASDPLRLSVQGSPKEGEGSEEATLPLDGQNTADDASPVADNVSLTPGSGALLPRLSAPEASDADGLTCYTAVLTVAGIDALFGYQLRIAAPVEAQVSIQNLVGGTATEPVYKEGSLYQAVLLGEGIDVSGDIALCEITMSYATDSAKAERVLTVEQIQVVTNLRAETMLTLGPTPPAVTMALVPLNQQLVALMPWLLIAGLAALVLAVLVVILTRRKTVRAPVTPDTSTILVATAIPVTLAIPVALVIYLRARTEHLSYSWVRLTTVERLSARACISSFEL